MQAHRVHVTIPEDHRVTIDVPAEVPTGDAEVILLSNASVVAPPLAGQQDSLSANARAVLADPTVALHVSAPARGLLHAWGHEAFFDVDVVVGLARRTRHRVLFRLR